MLTFWACQFLCLKYASTTKDLATSANLISTGTFCKRIRITVGFLTSVLGAITWAVFHHDLAESTFYSC